MAGGESDYSAIFRVHNLAALGREAEELQALLIETGAPRQAAQIRGAFIELTQKLNVISREIAKLAEVEIKKEERASRVRASKSGPDGEARLQDELGHSHSLGPGTVGVNFEPDLYQATPWWWTNEEGYSGHIGREIYGNFYGAGYRNGTRPSAEEFRKQTLFRPEEGGGRGVIKNPIPERRFVKKGMEAARVEWHRRVRQARDSYVRECAKIVATAPKPVPGGRRVQRTEATRRRLRLR